MTPLEAVIAKIKALRALAGSSNVHEAAAAAAQAEALLQKHRLDEAALETDAPPAEGAEEAAEPLAWHTQHLSWWRVKLGSALLASHGCTGYVSLRAGRRCQIAVGRPSDVATVRYLYAWLTMEIGRLSDAHGKGRGRTWRHSFCMGAVSAIRAAMTATKAQARAAGTSSALVALDRRDSDANALLARNHPDIKTKRGGRAHDRDAFRRGEEAGRAIHLSHGLSDAAGSPRLGP